MNKVDDSTVHVSSMVASLLGSYFSENDILALNCCYIIRTAIITGAMFDTETLSITDKKP